MQKVAIIGAGAVAQHLGQALVSKGYRIEQIFSRTHASAYRLARILDVPFYATDFNAISTDLDYVFLTTPDDQIASVVQTLKLYPYLPATFIHCSGSTPLETLRPLGDNIGVIYPLQTFSLQSKPDFSKIPVFYEHTALSLEKVTTIAGNLTTLPRLMNSADRQRVHIGGIFAANFTNFMIQLAAELLPINNHELDYSVYLPLVHEVVQKLSYLMPVDSQTGPAQRGDIETISKHYEYLKSVSGSHAQIYKLLSQQLANIHRKKK